MSMLAGLATPFDLLFAEPIAARQSLLPELAAAYGSDWHLPPTPSDRPLVIANLVTSRDGKVAFGAPSYGHSYYISQHLAHDRWLMGLLRARCDALMIGAATLREIPQARWFAEQIFPPAAELFRAQRKAEGRSPLPLVVILTTSGDLPANAQILNDPEQPVVIAAPINAAHRLRRVLGERPSIDYHVSMSDHVNLDELLRSLRVRHGVEVLLSEAGPRSLGQLVQHQLLDQLFLTQSPVIAGSPALPPANLSLIEGFSADPERPPLGLLLSLRRIDHFLFLHLELSYPELPSVDLTLASL